VVLVFAWPGLRQRTSFSLLACLAASVAAFAEPLYDVAFDLSFYDPHDGAPGARYSHFTAFGVVQPKSTHAGYIILYANACLYAGRRIYEGRSSRNGLQMVWGSLPPEALSSRFLVSKPT
jgi:hypothetical protein